MDSKAQIEAILKQRFFVTPTGYPAQNGFLDYGPPLAQIKLQILSEFRRIFVDEITYEMEPSAVLPYNVLKNSGHIDKFCDVILTDGNTIVRADHFIEEKIGEILRLPVGITENYAILVSQIEQLKNEIITEKRLKKDLNIKSKTNLKGQDKFTVEQFTEEEVEHILNNFKCETRNLADLNKTEIDLIVILYNLHSSDGLPFNPSKDYNLIFKLNDKQFLRPEIAQSQFTNFSKLLDLNNEKLPFSSLAIGRSYRNEISARGGMLRTKEFEQAEIEYFSESGEHSGFSEIRNVKVSLYPNNRTSPFEITLGDAYNMKIISSEAVCYFIAKALEFLLTIGFKFEAIRFRQHNPNEMAHYANDCWDAEIKTMCGWVECAGIADRGTYDLTCHSKDTSVKVRRHIKPKTIYEPVINRKEIGKALREKSKLLEELVLSMPQEAILSGMVDNKLSVEFEGGHYEFFVISKTVDTEFYIPKVIEPSFGISRILYSLVEQGFIIRDGRNTLSLPPKMCYLHCMVTFLKYLDCFAPLLTKLKNDLKSQSIRYQTNDRTCSIGKKYSSCDEIGIPYFITFDFQTPVDNCVTIRDRDTTSQIRVKIDEVAALIKSLILEVTPWDALLKSQN